MINKLFKKWIYFLLIGHCLLMTTLLPAALADEWRQQTTHRLQQWLRPKMVSAIWGCSEQRFDLHAALIRFYKYRQYRLAWVDSHGLLPEGEIILATIRHAAGQGLQSLDYYNQQLDELLNSLVAHPVVNQPVLIDKHIFLDLILTEMILRYAFHVTDGRTDPTMVSYSDKPGPPVHRDVAMELAAMLDQGDLAVFLEKLGPRHPAYRVLQKSLQEYRKVQAAGGWPVIDEGPTLKFGDRGMRVAMLRYRLAVGGDTHFASGVIDNRFDDELAVAVMHFQRRHGLNMDGMVGRGTLAALNVPVEQRIRQIELNLERWRWMPTELEPYYILVNIPGFELKVVDAGRTVKTLRAIVGREKRPTPVLSSVMTYLELNPYWYVPAKIAREDLLPKIQKDPQFLVKQGFRIFDSWEKDAHALDPLSIDWASLSEDHFPFRLRQEPAPYNALGKVKFMFPNDFSVYIHDTPSKGLFVRSSRDFSSGCVRVEKPVELAAFLLNRQNWNRKRLLDVLASKQRQVVILKEPVPVYLVYWTAWADENGEVHFREDIYGRDMELQNLLAESSAVSQPCTEMIHSTYVVQTGQAKSSAAGI